MHIRAFKQEGNSSFLCLHNSLWDQGRKVFKSCLHKLKFKDWLNFLWDYVLIMKLTCSSSTSLPSTYFSCSKQVITKETCLLTSHHIVVSSPGLAQLLPLVLHCRFQVSQIGVQHLNIITVMTWGTGRRLVLCFIVLLFLLKCKVEEVYH